MKRIIVGMTGASGAIYGVRLLEVLRGIPDVETHLVLSKGVKLTLSLETDYSLEAVTQLADITYDANNLAAAISSGSFPISGMVVAPCSMKSLAQIALSLNDNLLIRAADVTLKERRKLIIVPRETPLHLGHLRHMVAISEMGGVILPPMPAFYHAPKRIDDLINQTIGKILDQLELKHDLYERWQGR